MISYLFRIYYLKIQKGEINLIRMEYLAAVALASRTLWSYLRFFWCDATWFTSFIPLVLFTAVTHVVKLQPSRRRCWEESDPWFLIIELETWSNVFLKMMSQRKTFLRLKKWFYLGAFGLCDNVSVYKSLFLLVNTLNSDKDLNGGWLQRAVRMTGERCKHRCRDKSVSLNMFLASVWSDSDVRSVRIMCRLTRSSQRRIANS